MGRLIDLTGRRIGRLLVKRRFDVCVKPGQQSKWLCVCDCGSDVVVLGGNLHKGDTKSCGCYKSERTSEIKTTHGLCHTPEYRIWNNIRRRCLDPRVPHYAEYGARGITVCDRWRESFANFYADMGAKPFASATVERKNNNGPYSPENCVWATRREQANNTRRNRHITFHGRMQTLAQWAREVGMRPGTLQMRLDALGWTVERALTQTVGDR